VVVCRPKPGGLQTLRSGQHGGEESEDLVLKMRDKATLEQTGHSEEFRRVQARMLNIEPHPGVVPLYHVLEDNQHYYQVMHRADGGPLFDSLLEEYSDGCMPEAIVKGIMREILGAVAHLHRHGVLHRDLKPDNLVTAPDGSGSVGRVMLIDFDLGAVLTAPQLVRDEVVGTKQFSAPETFVGRFSRQSDLYSVGAILYLLMVGNLPYACHVYEDFQGSPNFGTRGQMVYQTMRRARIDWRGEPWQKQVVCKNFCRKLLSFAPSFRPACAEEALADPWFDDVHDS